MWIYAGNKGDPSLVFWIMNKQIVYFSILAGWFLSLMSLPASAAGSTDNLVWAGCGITKKAFMAELAREYEKKTGIHIELKGGGATKGIRAAANGQIDIGGACRISLQTAKERNAHQIPVAWDALVVITNPKNPVKNISQEELKGVYLGKISNWMELGGHDAPIELYIRRGKLSGVGRTLRELVFHNFEQDFKASYIEKSSGPVEKGVENNVNGIAVTGISSAKRRKVKLLNFNGKAPTYDNIKTGNYVLYRPLYLVTRKNISDPKVKDFIRFALSREGQDLIRKQGTVPYSEAMALVIKQLEQYQDASAGGTYRNQ